MAGGVCAVLDYDVELMAEYVAEMSTRLAKGTSRAPDTFRKFILQILSSTRLPRTTILLGMNYFAKRINMMNMISAGKLALSDGHIWRLLTVALLLGSKFLDDNTFQNRSWSDVSGIPVRELNKLEREWMDAIGWCLYVNLDRSEDYTAWIGNWRDWEAGKKRLQRLAMDSEYAHSVARHNATVAWQQEQIAECERLSRLKRSEPVQAAPQVPQQAYRAPLEQPQPCWAYQAQPDPWAAAPLTPPDSGYGTPEYMNAAASMNAQYDEWLAQQAQQAAHIAHAAQAACRAVASGAYDRQLQYPVTANPTPYHARNFPAKLPAYNFYGHNIWDNSVDSANGMPMGCVPHANYMGKQASYFGVPHPYGQPVMG